MRNIVTIDIGNTKTKLTHFADESNNSFGFLSIYTKDLESNIDKIKKFCNDKYVVMSSVVNTAEKTIRENIKVDYSISSNDFSKKQRKNLPSDIGQDILSVLFNYKDNKSTKFIVLTGTVWVGMLISESEIRGVNFIPGINYEISQLIRSADGINEFIMQEYNYLGLNTSQAMLDGVINSHIGYLEKVSRDLKNEWDSIEFIISSGEYDQIKEFTPSEFKYEEELVSQGLLKLAIEKIK